MSAFTDKLPNDCVVMQLCGLRTKLSHLQECQCLGFTEQTGDMVFSFAHVIDVLGELLHENPEFGLTTLHFSINCGQSITLLSGQQIPHLLILSCQSFLPVGR